MSTADRRPYQPALQVASSTHGSSRGDCDRDSDLGSDAELARAARGGDRKAFARLYERFAPAVHAVLLANAPVRESSDLVQEVFLSALRSIERLDEPESVGAWLFTIARNRARDACKRAARAVDLDHAPEPTAAPSDPAEAEAEDEAASARALVAIRSLPEAYRETLAMRLVEGLTGPEIAARTGLTHGSVRINLHRGMKLLRERLDVRREGPNA